MNLLLDWSLRIPPVVIFAAMTADALRDPDGGPGWFGVDMHAVAVVTFALAIVAMVAANPFKPDAFRPRHLVAFAPLIFAGAILVWGHASYATIEDPQYLVELEEWPDFALAWPAYGLVALAAGCLLAAIAAIGLNAGYRAFTATLVVIQLYAASACAIVAVMSMTGTLAL